jgi:arsenate reductase (thioredoxin)
VIAHQGYKVLFICTGNSARSILAEALLNALGGGRWRAYSAGSRPKSVVHPLALQELQRAGVATEGLRSKAWDEFALAQAPVMDFILTVCDQAAGETCPVWPGHPASAQWGLPDPAAVEGSDEAKAAAFRETAIALTRRIELLMALPLDRLDALALRHQIKQIGTL